MAKLSAGLARALVRRISTELNQSKEKETKKMLLKAEKCKELEQLNVLSLEIKKLKYFIETEYSDENGRIDVEYDEKKFRYYPLLYPKGSNYVRTTKIEDELALLTELSDKVFTTEEIIDTIIKKLTD